MPDFSNFNQRLSDLEFIRSKVLSGDWITVQGAINASGNEIAYTPATGKTFFLFEAKIVITTQTGLPSISGGSTSQNVQTDDMVSAALKVDTVTKDKVNVGMRAGASSGSASSGYGGAGSAYAYTDGHFNCLGLSLVGNSSKKVTIENIGDLGSADAYLSGWIENT